MTKVAEAAVRESIATELAAAVTSPLYPTHPNIAAPNGQAYMRGVASGIETAVRIARTTPTKEQ